MKSSVNEKMVELFLVQEPIKSAEEVLQEIDDIIEDEDDDVETGREQQVRFYYQFY